MLKECDALDISDTIIAKSDQLNAEDLIGGPITVTITGVKRTSDEQPVSVEISGGHKPWKPCKSMRRLLIMAWPDGAVKVGGETKYDPACWVGRLLTLIRDPNVRWAGELVGGIRVAALSHIRSKFEVALAESKKKKKLVTVEKIDAPAGTKNNSPKPNELTLVQKYAKRLAELKPEEIAPAYHKFDAISSTLPEEQAQAIYAEFAKYAPPAESQEPVI